MPESGRPLRGADAMTDLGPFIVNLAPTGMVPTRALSPKVPLQPAEIVENILACAKIGITIAHIHARADDGRPTPSRDIYARIIEGIRERRPDLILCVSCSGRNGASLEERSAVLSLKGDLAPDMASLTLSSMNFAREASVNAPATVVALADRMNEAGIKPEIEVFDLGMANVMRYLAARETLSEPFYVNLLFGSLASAQARLLEIGTVVSALPANTLYSLAGLGAAQLPVAAVAAASAPGVRIGLEDSLWLDSGRQLLATNELLVERVHGMAELVGRPIMQARDLRDRLGLKQRD